MPIDGTNAPVCAIPSPDPHISDAVVAAAQSAWAALDEHDKSIDECWRGALAAAILSYREERALSHMLVISNAVVHAACDKLYDSNVWILRADNTDFEAKVRDAIAVAVYADREERAGEVERLKAELAQLKSDFEEVQQSESELEQGCADLDLEIEDLTKERDDACAEIERLKEELEWLQCELKAAHSAGFELGARLNSCEEQLSIAKQQAEDAQGAVQVYCDDYSRVKAELDEAISALSIAEQATKTALESIPIAMTAAVAEAVEVLQPFAFFSCPNIFQSDDGGFTEVLIADSDVQRTRAFIEKHSPAIRDRSEAK